MRLIYLQMIHTARIWRGIAKDSERKTDTEKIKAARTATTKRKDPSNRTTASKTKATEARRIRVTSRKSPV